MRALSERAFCHPPCTFIGIFSISPCDFAGFGDGLGCNVCFSGMGGIGFALTGGFFPSDEESTGFRPHSQKVLLRFLDGNFDACKLLPERFQTRDRFLFPHFARTES
jgi:hypothetical protein